MNPAPSHRLHPEIFARESSPWRVAQERLQAESQGLNLRDARAGQLPMFDGELALAAEARGQTASQFVHAAVVAALDAEAKRRGVA